MKFIVFLMKINIEILGEIPFTKEYAASYASGNILDNISHEIKNIYLDIIEKLEVKIGLK